VVPSEYILRDVLIRVDPAHLDRALQRWNEVHARQDETLAIDGKTLCNALDAQGHPTHVMSVVGHQSQICYTPKKSRYLARRESGRSQAHQRDQNGHPAAGCPRY
jgi:hypothetical protein